MIRDRPNDVRDRLNNMYNKKPKFMCLNDDLPHDRDPSNETLATLKSFFHRMYPYPSPFELIDESKYHPYIRINDMVKNGYWKPEWSLINNKHYRVYSDRFEIKKAKKHNLYKKHKLNVYYDYTKDIDTANSFKNNMKLLYDSVFKNKSKKYSLSNKKNNKGELGGDTNNKNYSYHIDNDMPAPGEAYFRKEQIRTLFYSTIVRRFREFNWFIQFLALFIFCSIVVTIILKIVDIVWYYLTITFSWIFTNNPKLFKCCKLFSFKSWFGSNNQHND